MKAPPVLRTRIAPTPSGFLHLGNAVSFALTWMIARKAHGSLHLRIDDIDAERKRPEYVQDVFDVLDWLGLDYDTGPRSVADFEENWSQHSETRPDRQAAYRLALEHLIFAENVFACECSRSELRAQAQMQAQTQAKTQASERYPEVCTKKHLSPKTPNTALRLVLRVGEEVQFADVWRGRETIALDAELGSFVVRRKDGNTAYHLASLVDDVLAGVNFVVRGEDLRVSTAAQIALAERLVGLRGGVFADVDWPGFAQAEFLHHPLLLDSHGNKLSKSHNAESLKTLREQGVVTPADVFAIAESWLVRLGHE
jgi:glutamyl/glutaminyl-tRNA synthetase